MKRCLKLRKRGATATEFAVLLPLIITLCLVAVDLGRFAYASIAIGNAARVGAEWGATHRYDVATDSAWRSNLEDAIEAEFPAVADLDPAQLDTAITITSDSYSLQRIDVTAQYSWNTLITWPMIPRPLLLQHKTVMRRYR